VPKNPLFYKDFSALYKTHSELLDILFVYDIMNLNKYFVSAIDLRCVGKKGDEQIHQREFTYPDM